MPSERNTSSVDLFRDDMRGWLAEYCPPWAQGSGPVNAGGRKHPPSGDAALWLNRCAERGYTVPMWPKEYGGAGLSTMQYQILLEEMRRISARSPLAGMGIGLIGPTLLEFGTEEQKQRHLPAIARGEVRWCQGYSEPNAGSDLAGCSLLHLAVRLPRVYQLTHQETHAAH